MELLNKIGQPYYDEYIPYETRSITSLHLIKFMFYTFYA